MRRLLGHLNALLLAALLVAPALAAEGRTPVFAPGSVLATDGKYILTQNLTGPGPVIRICGTNVDLDLNGMVVTNTTASATITSNGCPGPVDHVTIRNGTVVRGGPGIYIPGPTRRVEIEDVKVKDSNPEGIHLFAVEATYIRRVDMIDIVANGILWNGGVAHGTIEDSLFRRCGNGMFIAGCSSLAILHNRIEEGGGTGIGLFNCSAALVAENTIERRSSDGINIANGTGIKVFDNVVVKNLGHGISLDQNTLDTLVLNNNASDNGIVPGPGIMGIMVMGKRNMIQGNILNGNAGSGLFFSGSGGAGFGCENTYGRNTARGNMGAGVPPCGPAPPGQLAPNYCDAAAATCGAALPNSSFGDNLMPGPPNG